MQGAAPLVAFVIKGNVAHLTGGGIGQLPGEPVIEVSGQEEEVGRFFEDLRLVLPDPVKLGFGLEMGHRTAQAGCSEEKPPMGRQTGRLVGPPLVSGRETNQPQRVVHVRHKQVLSGDSAIVIFGRFHDGQGGLLNAPPVIIKPPPAWNDENVIGVGRAELERLDD